MGALGAPEPLSAEHDFSQFNCTKGVLDRWLQKHARENESRGASRTYVVCEKHRVIGYFCLANGSVAQANALAAMGQRMPDPIPVILLGRLAVDRDFHGQGIGPAMLRDAFLRARKAAETSAACALLVHALDDEAKQFYAHHGFLVSPVDTHTLMHSLY